MDVTIEPAEPVLFDYEIQLQIGTDANGVPIYKIISPGWIRINTTFTNKDPKKPVTIMAVKIVDTSNDSECVIKPENAALPIAELTVAPTDTSVDGTHKKKVTDMYCGSIALEPRGDTANEATDPTAKPNIEYGKSFRLEVLGYTGTLAEPSGRLIKSVTFSTQ